MPEIATRAVSRGDISEGSESLKAVLDIPFKGSRTYIHGPSLFDKSQETLRLWFGDGTYVKNLTMRRMARDVCVLETADEPSDPGGLIATATCVTPSGEAKLRICETAEPTGDRIPYPESDAVQGAAISGETISGGHAAGFSRIEQIVALTKDLHLKTQPGIDGQWIVLKVELADALDNAVPPFEIRIVNKLGGRMTISEIRAGGEKVGRIHFGVYKA